MLWEECNKKNNLKTIIVDVSFPSSMREMAETTKHLTTDLFLEEIGKIKSNDVSIYITHIKPQLLDEVKQEIAELSTRYNVNFLTQDLTINV